MTKHHNDFASWEASFRSAAKADANSMLGEHLAKLDLQVDPALLLEGTIDFVGACVAFAELDVQQTAEFLDLQEYEPRMAVGATYAITFDVFRKGYARVLTSSDLRDVDFADLYGTPWYRYECVGYGSFWVARIDGNELSQVELNDLERAITEDLRYDYSEDELEFWFVPDGSGALLVMVRDQIETDD